MARNQPRNNRGRRHVQLDQCCDPRGEGGRHTRPHGFTIDSCGFDTHDHDHVERECRDPVVDEDEQLLLDVGGSPDGGEQPIGRNLGRLVMSAFSSNATWYLMRSSGVVALVLLTAVFVLGIAINRRWRPARAPRVVTASLHRTISLLAVAFLGAHVLTAVVDPYAVVGAAAVIVPFAAGRSAFWVGFGAMSLDLVAALIVSSLLRTRVAPRLWRGIHWTAYLAWPLALAHSFGTGTDASSPWLEATGAVCITAVVGSVLWRITAERGAKHLEPHPAAA